MRKFYFEKAQAIWADGRSEEMNCELSFRTVIPKGEETKLFLAASSIYRLWVNGEFICAGPARAAHGWYRVDEICLSPFLTEDRNYVVTEVLGYNVNSYDTLDQPSFLTEEIWQGNEVISYTGGESITIHDFKNRVQKVQRYSFQRAFIDAYQYEDENKYMYHMNESAQSLCKIEIQTDKRYIYRDVEMPGFETLEPVSVIKKGTAYYEKEKTEIIPEEYFFKIKQDLKGYAREKTEIHVSEEAQKIQLQETECSVNAIAIRQLPLSDEYAIYELPYNATGFFDIRLEVREKSRTFVMFDEILSNGSVDFLRMNSCNCFVYRMNAGKYRLMNFAPYTMKYLQIVVLGECIVEQVQFKEYKNSSVLKRIHLPQDTELALIYDAALESFRANALDLFMDCPSRERGGWLCDSYFTSSVEYVLTGKNVIEKAFLENFILNKEFRHIPEGMIPMCYPADHNNGNFIPQWAMWYVLEIEKYVYGNQDFELAERSKNLIYSLLKYFESFENENGMLENLQGWNFIEWSRANDPDLVNGVNFPTNMLYMRMLKCVSALYKDLILERKADRLRKNIRKRSFNGMFYTDNEHRDKNQLVNPGICTEVCQYYAFFTGVATVKEDSELWKIMKNKFGPIRSTINDYPEIAGTNVFIGKYLRIELLYRQGLFEEVIKEIKEVFLGMAKETGTLWEHTLPTASCNHGFASYVLYWLAGIFGIEE
jgi:alpha-L-rhamnosidase